MRSKYNERAATTRRGYSSASSSTMNIKVFGDVKILANQSSLQSAFGRYRKMVPKKLLGIFCNDRSRRKLYRARIREMYACSSSHRDRRTCRAARIANAQLEFLVPESDIERFRSAQSKRSLRRPRTFRPLMSATRLSA